MVVMKMIDHNHRHHHHRVGSSSVRISDFLVSLSPSPDSPRKISAITCCLGLWLFFVWLFPIQVWSLDYCLVLDLSSVQWIPDVSRMSNAGYWSSNWLISSNFHALIISSFSQFMSLLSHFQLWHVSLMSNVIFSWTVCCLARECQFVFWWQKKLASNPTDSQCLLQKLSKFARGDEGKRLEHKFSLPFLSFPVGKVGP